MGSILKQLSVREWPTLSAVFLGATHQVLQVDYGEAAPWFRDHLNPALSPDEEG